MLAKEMRGNNNTKRFGMKFQVRYNMNPLNQCLSQTF